MDSLDASSILATSTPIKREDRKMKIINKIRRALYRTNSVLGDANAISRGPGPTAKRFLVRKPAWRTFSKFMRKVN